jgi:hypothetical protein
MTKPSSKKKNNRCQTYVFHTTEAGHTGSAREDIERRAYELYLARGQADGYSIEDWQQAEQELQARQP